jgi:transposase
MSGLFVLTEAQIAKLAPLLPNDTRGVPRVDDRRVISGIVHVLRSGCRWSDAPRAYGPHKTLYNRFVRWAVKGVWEAAFRALADAGGPPAEMLLDSSTMKAHRCASGGKGGSGGKRSASAAADAPASSTP